MPTIVDNAFRRTLIGLFSIEFGQNAKEIDVSHGSFIVIDLSIYYGFRSLHLLQEHDE